MPHTVIFGAGISGLTLAHELIEKGFKVDVYDSDTIAGGMARSLRYENNNIPTEHSWRGYGPFYYNTYDILGRIPKPKKPIVDSFINRKIENFTNQKINAEESSEPKYTRSQVELHNKDTDAWVIYKGYIYDITHFVKRHPGGSLIKNSYGKDIEVVWSQFNVKWHMTDPSVITVLKKNKVGVLIEEMEEEDEEVEEDEDGEYDDTLTLVDNLIDVDFKLLKNTIKHPYPIKIHPIDYPYLGYSFLKPLLSNKRKPLYFKEKFLPYMKYVTSRTRNFLLDYVAGPGYGFDKNTISLGHYSLFLAYQLSTGNANWKVMNAPTSEAWIDIWVDFLKKKGVNFYFGTGLKKIITDNDITKKINYCIDTDDNKIIGDEYAICINPYNATSIFKNSNMNDLATTHENISTINNQISFRLGFNKKLHLGDRRGYVLMDSPYNITFYAQDEYWDTSVNIGNTIQSLWSGTCINTMNVGVLYNKTAIECTPNQLIEEIIAQFFNSKELLQIIKNENKYELTKDDIVFKEIFNDWYFNSQTQQLESKNKKWVNNIYNEAYRPDNHTAYTNLYLAGSHTKTTVNIWSMESAVESGKLASNHILKKYEKEECTLFQFEMPRVLTKIGKIDDVLYRLYLPHIIDTVLILIIVIIIVIIYYIFYK